MHISSINIGIHRCGEDCQPWLCAHQDKGYSEAHEEFYGHVAHICRNHRVSLLGGDFNVALFATPHQMATRYIEARFLGPYAFRRIGGMVAAASSTSPAVEG